jgi:hypothetical protein
LDHFALERPSAVIGIKCIRGRSGGAILFVGGRFLSLGIGGGHFMRSGIRSWLGLWQRFGFGIVKLSALRARWEKRAKARRKLRARRDDTLSWTHHRCGFEGLEARRMLAAFSVSDPTITEGGTAQFVVSYTGSLTGIAMVSYATANNTALTSDGDYTAASGALMFMQGGATSQTVNVSTTGDTKDEDDETFYLNLSNPSNATIADSQGVATIQDNDSPPTLSINDPSAGEGGSATHTVTLSAASGKTITVDYATADNSSAVAGTDYTAASGTLVPLAKNLAAIAA